jgi:hypothetical protein
VRIPEHPLSTARFPALGRDAGHYESFYVKLADPERPRGVWIRHTVFKRPGEAPVGSRWCILWPESGRPIATKLTVDTLGVEVGEYIHIGESRVGPGWLRGGVNDAEWDLTFTDETELFTYNPNEALYTQPVPRTKSLAIHPYAAFSGRVTFGDEVLEIDNWPGMVGHNWGEEHPHEWIWLQGARFEGVPDAWFDGTIFRLEIDGVVAPWTPNGVLHLDGRTYRVAAQAGAESAIVEAERTRVEFKMGNADVSIDGTVEAPAERFVAWQYSDPQGGEHITSNCSVASMTLDVTLADGATQRLFLPAGAAYELGRYGAPSEIPVQSFPDP